MGAADRLRSAGRKVVGNPWLAVGIVIGLLLVCAWIGWAIHVWSEHGARQGLGVLIVWPAIVAILAAIVMSLVSIYLLIRPREGSEHPAEKPAEKGEHEESEPEAEAAAS